MQSEQFDKKVKEAADRHHPAYDEQAWNRMEKLLDKHLPVKEEGKKRFIFFLLLFLLLGGGAFLAITKPWQGDKKIVASNTIPGNATDKTAKENTNTINTTPGSPDNTIETNNENATIEPVEESGRPNTVTDRPVNNNTPIQTTIAQNNKPGSRSFSNTNDQSSFSVINGNKASSKKDKSKKEAVNAITDQPLTNTNTSLQTPEILIPAIPSQKNDPVTTSTKPVTTSPATEVNTDKAVQKEEPVIAKTDVPEKKTADDKKKKDKKKKNSSLFVGFSAGPDLSFVGSGNSSKIKLVAGAGIGFTYKERFTLRTGFYTGRKIYSAKPSDYKAPPQFYSYYPYLEKIDANCKVYEIPLAISYNFGKKKNLFVSAGVSSFLMKEETYNYFYKYTATGNTYTNKWTIKNDNSHYFSVGTISAGYKKDIGKRITVMAEPYIKIPFAGVGYGKVKLNSAGVLFTVGVKVF